MNSSVIPNDTNRRGGINPEEMPHICENQELKRRRQSLASPISSLKNCTYVHIYLPLEVDRFTSFCLCNTRSFMSHRNISWNIYL